MFTLIQKRMMVAVLVIVMLSLSVMLLAFAFYFTPAQGRLSSAAQGQDPNMQLVSSGSTDNTNAQDPRFCVVPLEGIERLTGKESTH
jgi:hypothetical protein